MRQYLRPDGTFEPPDDPRYLLPDETLLEAYHVMVRSRAADDWAVSLNRQGRMSTYPPSSGQEACAAGAALALEKDDWLIQAYRELAGLLIRGVPLKNVYQYWYGNEHGNVFDDARVTPVTIPIASQCLHAVGIAHAERHQKTGRVALVFVGDGGTSEGDFHEAMNFAGTWQAPVIFFVQNNHYAISTPRERQTASSTFAQKASAYGFDGVMVDGNDITAVYEATCEAVAHARAGNGPTLIEGVTYRLGAHTTSDDPSKYRKQDEVDDWLDRDPKVRLGRYLTNRGLLDDEQVQEIAKQARSEAIATFDEVESVEKPTLEDGFRFVFEQMPPLLERQLEERRQLLASAGEGVS